MAGQQCALALLTEQSAGLPTRGSSLRVLEIPPVHRWQGPQSVLGSGYSGRELDGINLARRLRDTYLSRLWLRSSAAEWTELWHNSSFWHNLCGSICSC